MSSAVQDPYQQDSVEEEMEIDGRKVVQQGKMICAEGSEEKTAPASVACQADMGQPQCAGLDTSIRVRESSSQRKRTFKKKRSERRGSGGEAAAQGANVDRKRQLPEEIDVDSLSPKKMKWVGNLSMMEDLSEVGSGEIEILCEKAGLQEQFRQAK